MSFNFGEVLTRAWQIIWKHRVLWIFGILAGCAQGRSGGNFGGNSGGGGGAGGSGNNPNNPFEGQQFDQFSQWISEHLWVVALIVVAIILLSLLFYFIGTIGRIGLIKGTYKAEQGAESMSFGELWSESQPYFWRVFGLSFLIGLIFLIIFIPLILLGVVTAGVGFICILPLICILFPVALVVGIIVEQADAAIVIENLSMFDGFKRGWDIFKTNWGPLLVMMLILGIGGAIVGTVFAVPLLIAVLPAAFGAAQGNNNMFIIAAACCILYLPVLIFLNGLLTAYIQSAWTLTFMRLTAKPQENAPVFVEGNAS